MRTKTKTYIDDLIVLKNNAYEMYKQIEKLNHDADCPETIKNDVLRPIKNKISWLKSTLESKLLAIPKNYSERYNESILLNKMSRAFAELTPEQQDVFIKLIEGMKDGSMLEVKVIDPVEEIF